MANLPARIGTGIQLSVTANSELKRVRYPSSGIELLGNSRLLANSLTDATAAPVQIKRFGATAKSELLRVGMDLVTAFAVRSETRPLRSSRLWI